MPAWLNDPTMYHNRGDSTFAGENSEYGDFFGLDDLWTERPEVVPGMTKIYERLGRDIDIDGFRIDTAKHVNLDFWPQFATAHRRVREEARQARLLHVRRGLLRRPRRSRRPTSRQGRLDGDPRLPLPGGGHAPTPPRAAPADRLADVYADDYLYAAGRANAYELPTFLGNHDMGRIGTFLRPTTRRRPTPTSCAATGSPTR